MDWRTGGVAQAVKCLLCKCEAEFTPWVQTLGSSKQKQWNWKEDFYRLKKCGHLPQTELGKTIFRGMWIRKELKMSIKDAPKIDKQVELQSLSQSIGKSRQ
jgi:hypothetical protein